MLIHGYLADNSNIGKPVRRKSLPWTEKQGALQPATFAAGPVRFVMRDFDLSGAAVDWARTQGLDIYAEPREAIAAVIRRFAPELAAVKSLAALSGSAGIDKNGGIDGAVVRFHLFQALSRPVMPSNLKDDEQQRLLRLDEFCSKGANGHLSGPRDPKVFDIVQPNFIAPPTFIGCNDPIAERWFMFDGSESQDADFLLRRQTTPTIRRAKAGETRRQLNRRQAENAAEIAKWEVKTGETYVADNALAGPATQAWPRSFDDCLALMGYDDAGHKTDKNRGITNPIYWAALRFVETYRAVIIALDARTRATFLARRWTTNRRRGCCCTERSYC